MREIAQAADVTDGTTWALNNRLANQSSGIEAQSLDGAEHQETRPQPEADAQDQPTWGEPADEPQDQRTSGEPAA
jgi:hypothetical protein